MNKVTVWTEEEDWSERAKFLNNIKSFDHFFISYLCIEPHAFLHAGFLLQKHKDSFENKRALSIGFDICKELILLRANPSSVTVIDTDEAAIESARSLASKIMGNSPIEYILGDANDLDVKTNYDTVLMSQMDYCLEDEVYSSLLDGFYRRGVKEVIILTPSIYEFSLNPYKIVETLEFFLSAVKRVLRRSKYPSATFRRKKSYFEKIISQNYQIADHFEYKYPSGREHLYRLVKL